MTITVTNIIEDSAQADGRRHIGFKFTFHTGEEVIRRFTAPASYIATIAILNMKPKIESYMIEENDSELMGQIEADKVAALDAEPVHPETDSSNVRIKRLHRKILRWIMRERDLKLARKVLYPIWYYLKFESGYSLQQIANYFDISLGVLSRVNARFQAIHDNLSMLDNDNGYIEEVE